MEQACSGRLEIGKVKKKKEANRKRYQEPTRGKWVADILNTST